MLELLFGNQNLEKIFFFLLRNEKCYGKQIADRFETALSPVQRTLGKLEKAGVIISFLVGKTRMYEFNPRYPFLKELIDFFEKAYTYLPDTIKCKYEPTARKRPRRTGKPL